MRIISAASATLRKAIAGRSRITAKNITVVMMKARSVETALPDTAKYHAPPKMAAAAAHFLMG